MKDLSKRLRTILLLSSIVLMAVLLALQIDIALPATPDILAFAIL